MSKLVSPNCVKREGKSKPLSSEKIDNQAKRVAKRRRSSGRNLEQSCNNTLNFLSYRNGSRPNSTSCYCSLKNEFNHSSLYKTVQNIPLEHPDGGPNKVCANKDGPVGGHD